MEHVAFYAPMKPPDDPVPSGEREMARLFQRALAMAGYEVELACRLRSREGKGDPARQVRLERAGQWLAGRLTGSYRARASSRRPVAWFTYHLYYKAMDWVGPKVARALDIPYLAAEVSVAPKRAMGPWRHSHAALLRTIEAADCIFPLTEVNAECLPPSTRLGSLEPFIDPTPFSRAREEREAVRARLASTLQLDRAGPWIAVAAMMRFGVKSQSFALLGAALSQVLPTPFQLLVAGDGPARGEVEAALSILPAERVRFLGRLEQAELAELFAAADLYAWPSIGEAFGVSLLEAQAAGLPIVAGRDGGVGSVVGDQESGLLVEPGDVRGFAEATAQLLASRETRARLSAGAKLRIDQRHSLAKAATTLSEAIATAKEHRRTTGNACPSSTNGPR